MQEMVEPDRTILIVSIIGLVVIWGSVAYHKFLQDGREALADAADEGLGPQAAQEADVPTADPGNAPPAAQSQGKSKGKKGRRR